MPRKARVVSKTKIYHVILRGVNQQVIFEDEEDFQYFITVLEKCKEICAYKIFVYCLMNNHKYDRIGHLFQDRFRSEPVETERYFLTVVRYIFQNPVKAGIVPAVNQYQWCNYQAYLGVKDFTDVEKVML